MMSENIGGFEPKKIVITAAVIAAIAITVVGAAILMEGSGGGSENTQEDNIEGKWHFAMDSDGFLGDYFGRTVPTLIAVDQEGLMGRYGFRRGLHEFETLVGILDNVSDGAEPYFTLEKNGLENELDRGEVPEELESKFATGNITLPENTQIIETDIGWDVRFSGVTYSIKEEVGGLGVYFKMPDFTATTFDNQPFTLSEHRGEVVLLDFMAVGCPPCRQQMPELKELDLERGENVTILSVDVWYYLL